jgi:uncharacterized membrane protein
VLPLFPLRILALVCLFSAAGAFGALAQEGTCPDGGRPYFGVCPDGKPPTPGPTPAPSPPPAPRPVSPPTAPVPPSSPSSDGQWAAAAHDDDFWSFSWQYDTEAEAKSSVLEQCRKSKSNCEFVTATQGCIALARVPNGEWGAWATRTTVAEAESAAIATCTKSGRTNCSVPTIVCGSQGKVRWETANNNNNTSNSDEDQLFSFKVCNDSKDKAFLAVAGRFANDPSDWRVKGWWSVDTGSCEDVGKFLRGEFYAMAEVAGNEDRSWGDDDLKLCVAHPGPFDRVRSGHDTCDSQDLIGFQKFDIDKASWTWRLTD